MTRNFGMVSRTAEGGIIRDPAQSRAGATREFDKQSRLRENVTAGFIGVFGAGIFVVLWFLCLVVDWGFVGDLYYRICNFG